MKLSSIRSMFGNHTLHRKACMMQILQRRWCTKAFRKSVLVACCFTNVQGGLYVFAQSGSMLSSSVHATIPAGDDLDQTARLVGVQREIQELHAVTTNSEANRWKMLYLHQVITEHIYAVAYQVDATVAQIDNEIARARELGSYLSDKRDHAVGQANLLGILLGGGLGAASSGLQLSSANAKPAAAVGIGAGALSAAFGLSGIHAQRGAAASFSFESNMLAEFFDRPVLEDSRYPVVVNAFLDGLPLNHPRGLSRRQELLETWVQVRRIDSLESREKIDRLTSQPSDHLRLTIDDLEDRAAMLQDVRARISYLKRDLGTLLASLPAIPEDKTSK